MTEPDETRETPPKWIWLVIGWFLPAAVLGIPYFNMSYNDVLRSNLLLGGGLAVVFVGAAVVRILGQVRWWQAAGAPLLGLLTVVVSRIAADVHMDPTSHNLWPFELAIVIVAGGVVAIVGAWFGGRIGRGIGRS